MAIFRATASFRQYMSKSRFKSFPVGSETPSIRRFFSADALASFQSVGFIGLGNMGTRMANNLIKAGYNMVVHDINRNTMKNYSDRGVATKETPFEVAEASDVVITMLPSPSHVLDVYNGSHGLLHGGSHIRPWLLIDSSTIDPQTSRELSAVVSSCVLKEKRGSWESPVMLDAPVSGGVLAADARTLTFMVGGLEEAYHAAKALFLAMGKGSVYCGGAGNGSEICCSTLIHAVCNFIGSEDLQQLGIGCEYAWRFRSFGSRPVSWNFC